MSVNSNIANYMTSMSMKKFTSFDVGIIMKAMKIELEERKRLKLNIRVKSREGRAEINKRTSKKANELVGNVKYTPEDIRLYKRCKGYEYEDRTGKCSWGIPNVREKFCFDPVTGLQINMY